MKRCRGFFFSCSLAASQNIVINSVLKEAYKGNALMNDHMSGDFPVLKSGLNAFSWSRNVTQVVVKPNWRYL